MVAVLRIASRYEAILKKVLCPGLVIGIGEVRLCPVTPKNRTDQQSTMGQIPRFNTNLIQSAKIHKKRANQQIAKLLFLLGFYGRGERI